MTLSTFVSTAWIKELTADLAAASSSFSFSAISMLPPRKSGASYFDAFWNELYIAASRGVLVKAYIPKPSLAHPATRQNRSTANHLAERGCRVYLLDPSRLLHAKTAMIDDSVAWVGSGNFTAAAAGHNFEAFIRSRDRLAVDALSFFLLQLERESDEVFG